MKRFSLCSLALVALFCACAPADVATVVAAQRVCSREIVVYAAVTATETVSLTFDKGAVVTEVTVEAGDRVAAGDSLLTVDKNGETVTLVATVPGIVAEVAAPGASSDGKRPLCALMDTRRLAVAPLLTEGDVAAVSPGDEATVAVLSSGRTYPAVVVKTSALPESDDGRYRARLALDNTDGPLLPGMTVQVTLSVKREGVMLPHTAVGYDDGYYAYSETGEKLHLLDAVYGKEGYLVTGIEAGRVVARSVERFEP